MKYIICVDVLWESIKQLHRVIYDTNDTPYDDKSIFKNKIDGVSDNKYFKTIRPCFSTHQVALKDNFQNKDKMERRYASYPGYIGKGDLTVFLYSNEPDCKDIEFNIYFDELDAFVKKRLDYIKTLISELNGIHLENK